MPLVLQNAELVYDAEPRHAPDFNVFANFPGRNVTAAWAALSSFNLNFRNGSHDVEEVGIHIFSVDFDGENVRVSGRVSLRDGDGWDDPFTARLGFLVFAEVD